MKCILTDIERFESCDTPNGRKAPKGEIALCYVWSCGIYGRDHSISISWVDNYPWLSEAFDISPL